MLQCNDRWYGLYLKKDINEWNPNKKQKISMIYDDMFADMLSNKKLQPKVTILNNLSLFYQKKYTLFYIQHCKQTKGSRSCN